jgi:cobalt/nickel transport system ATP-binding protein
MESKKNIILHLEEICFGYPQGPAILQGVSFAMRQGERIGLIAPNGSGKTTLFHIIMGLLKPTAGRMKIFGRTVQEEKDFISVRQRIGLLFQDADDQLFSPTVLEDVAFGPLNLGRGMDAAMDISLKTLKMLGLEGFEDRVTHKLSGGEKRLVALATILSMEPEVLLLDEPTSGLDETTKSRLVDILKNLSLSYIIISHEYDFINEMADMLYTLHQGRIFEDPRHVSHVHEHSHPMGQQPHNHLR